jgi:serine/threonine-protein kinase
MVAEGGMGRVYEALDLHDKARVAIKVLHADVARDSIALERDHIVDVRDFRETEDKSFALVMEFLEGEELRMALKRDKVIAPERLVRLLSQAALGLDQAHRQKLVHRDLKPDNLFLCGTREGDVVKVLDFGSVKDNSTMAKKLTVAGTTIGSPYYMAPEQAQGLETLDARADVWALAAIAYECLTGTVPFQGMNGPSILLAILTEEPRPPTEAAKGAPTPVPPGIDDVMEVALAKNANIRTRSVGELADAVGRAYGLSGGHGQWARTPQSVLAEKIHAELPRLLSLRREPPPRAAPPLVALEARAALASGGVAPTLPDELPMGVPKGPPRWLVPALVGVLSVIAGQVGAVLYMR